MSDFSNTDVYRLGDLCNACATGPISSFLVISDPAAAKHVLRATDNPKRPIYVKGLVAEVGRLILSAQLSHWAVFAVDQCYWL